VRKRTQAREFALKALYQKDVRGELPPASLDALCAAESADDMVPFGRELVEGCLANQQSIDKIIEETAENWRIDRMPIIDRNILRLATYEMVCRDDTPPKVAINEAIELAKRYSTENSPTFVNGVLDKVYCTHARERKGGSADESEAAQEEDDCGRGDRYRFEADPEARADLHVHSTASDGSLEPEEVVRLAAQSGLSAIALTDHDTVEGVAAAALAAAEVGIRLIPAVELTAYADREGHEDELELHLIGLFVDTSDLHLLAELHRLREVRVARIEKMAEKLRSLGFQFDSDDVLNRALGGAVGRVHVARQMVEQGICSDMREAFDRYIGAGGPAYVPKERLTPSEAIGLIRSAGGCPVLAHPGVTGGVEDLLKELTEAGLAGIEVHCPGHTADDERRFLDAARELRLAVSGGSDFHGHAGPHVSIGQEFVSFVEVCDLASRSGE
jgi:transcription antitermination factor NusB